MEVSIEGNRGQAQPVPNTKERGHQVYGQQLLIGIDYDVETKSAA